MTNQVKAWAIMLIPIVFLVGYGLGRYDHEFDHEGNTYHFDKQGQPYPDGNTSAWVWKDKTRRK